MEIRKLTGPDFERWNAMRTMALDVAPVAFGSSNVDEVPKRGELFRRNTETPDHFILGLFDGDLLIGITGFYRHDQQKVKHKGTIWSVFIHPDHQGKGLGRKLMAGVLQHVFDINGMELVLLGASANNPTAIGLYKSLGFVEYGCEPKCLKHEGQYYDEVLLTLDREDFL